MEQVVRFAECRFDRETGRLWVSGEEVRLTPKAAAVLTVLLDHAGTPVSKAYLFDSVWRGAVVTDDALTSCVRELRRALGDDARLPRFIETRHRRGYRFVATLVEDDGSQALHAGANPYDHYVRGRRYLLAGSGPDLDAGEDSLRHALALDDAYAPAWATLAALRALRYELFGECAADLAEAERAHARAMELAPALAESHVASGCILTLHGRHEDAAAAYERATRLDPHLFEAYYYFGRSALARRDVLRAATLFRSAAGVRPQDYQSAMFLAQSLRLHGDISGARNAYREGLRRVERVLVLNPLDRRALALGALALVHEGDPARAMEWSRRALEMGPDELSALFYAACARGQMGLETEAAALLERIFELGWGQRAWLGCPECDALHAEPRFRNLLANLC
jgi:adenylate cyclase